MRDIFVFFICRVTVPFRGVSGVLPFSLATRIPERIGIGVWGRGRLFGRQDET